jgi:DNA-binding LacI/PurR family transcriptional regulator
MAGLSLAVARGISVPGDLSVTGYDDTEIAAHLQPSLTTVTTDVVAWGRAAATRLLEMVDGREPSPVDLPPARLVVRASTGPAPRRP